MVGKVLIDASLDAKLEALRWSIDEDHFSTVETVLRTSEINPRLWASALLRSCELGRINIAQLVIHVLGADKHQLPLDHCLCTAVKNGHREVVFHLIEANANDTESIGRTPLILAAEHGYGNIIIVLLKLGADPDVITDCDRLALKEAAQNGHLLAVKLLLGSGKCRVDARAKDSTPTALHLAAEMGHVEVVQTLLEAGADANLTYQAGWTPLYYACQNEHVEIIKALIEYGANTLVQDRWNVTPLSYACSHGLSHAVLALLENNVDPNFPIDYSGASKIRPIHFAAENGYHQIVEYLLKFRADSTKSLAKTKETPLLLALK
ncbi:ankyrin repeat-containing domain protein, partial [Pyronema domesticum]